MTIVDLAPYESVELNQISSGGAYALSNTKYPSRIFETFSTHGPSSPIRLIALSNLYGFTVSIVCVQNNTLALVYLPTVALRTEINEQQQHKDRINFSIPDNSYTPHLLSLTADELTLVVIASRSHKGQGQSMAYLFDIPSIKSGSLNLTPKLSIPLAGRVLNVQCHSQRPLVAVLLQGCGIQIYDLSQKTPLTLKYPANVASIGWHAHSNQLACGTTDGQVILVTTEGQSVKSLGTPIKGTVSFVYSLDEQTIVCGSSAEDGRVSLFVIEQVASSAPTIFEVDNPCFEHQKRPMQIHVCSLPQPWSQMEKVVLLSYTASNDTSILVKDQHSSWVLCDLDSEHRMELPVPPNETDNGAFGMALDLTADKGPPPANPDDPPNAPCPIVYIVTDDGKLLSYYLENKGSDAAYVGIRKPLAIPKAEAKPNPSAITPQTTPFSFGKQMEASKATVSFAPTTPLGFSSGTSGTPAFTQGAPAQTTDTSLKTQTQTLSKAFPAVSTPSDQSKPTFSFGTPGTTTTAPATGNLFGGGFGITATPEPPKAKFSFGQNQEQQPNTSLQTGSFMKNNAAPTPSLKEVSKNGSSAPKAASGGVSPQTPVSQQVNAPKPSSKKTASTSSTHSVTESPIKGSQDYIRIFTQICKDMNQDLRKLKEKVRSFVQESNSNISKLTNSTVKMADLIEVQSAACAQEKVSYTHLEKELAQLKERMLTSYTKLAEAESFCQAKSHNSFSKFVKIRELPPEQAEQQRKLRQNLQSLTNRVTDVEDYLKIVNEFAAEKTTSRQSSFDAIYRTMKNINYTALAKSAEVEELLEEVNKLTASVGLNDIQPLPPSIRNTTDNISNQKKPQGACFYSNKEKDNIRMIRETVRSLGKPARLNDSLVKRENGSFSNRFNLEEYERSLNERVKVLEQVANDKAEQRDVEKVLQEDELIDQADVSEFEVISYSDEALEIVEEVKELPALPKSVPPQAELPNQLDKSDQKRLEITKSEQPPLSDKQSPSSASVLTAQASIDTKEKLVASFGFAKPADKSSTSASTQPFGFAQINGQTEQLEETKKAGLGSFGAKATQNQPKPLFGFDSFGGNKPVASEPKTSQLATAASFEFSGFSNALPNTGTEQSTHDQEDDEDITPKPRRAENMQPHSSITPDFIVKPTTKHESQNDKPSSGEKGSDGEEEEKNDDEEDEEDGEDNGDEEGYEEEYDENGDLIDDDYSDLDEDDEIELQLVEEDIGDSVFVAPEVPVKDIAQTSLKHEQPSIIHSSSPTKDAKPAEPSLMEKPAKEGTNSASAAFSFGSFSAPLEASTPSTEPKPATAAIFGASITEKKVMPSFGFNIAENKPATQSFGTSSAEKTETLKPATSFSFGTATSSSTNSFASPSQTASQTAFTDVKLNNAQAAPAFGSSSFGSSTVPATTGAFSTPATSGSSAVSSTPQNNAAAFSAFGNAQQSVSAFGSPSALSNNATSSFGAPSSLANNAAPAFSSTAFPAKPSFGTPAALGNSVPSAFGSPSSLGANSPAFGSPAVVPSPFGASTATSATSAAPAFGASAFGAIPKTGVTAFGRPSNLGAAAPAFGAPAFGASNSLSSNAPAFGSPSALGQTATFGSSSFGSTAFGSTPGPGFGAVAQGQQSSVFGQQSSGQQPVFGSAYGTGSGFASVASTNSNVFGSTTNNSSTPSAFGQFRG